MKEKDIFGAAVRGIENIGSVHERAYLFPFGWGEFPSVAC